MKQSEPETRLKGGRERERERETNITKRDGNEERNDEWNKDRYFW